MADGKVRVNLQGYEKKRFMLGVNEYITLEDGALLSENHVFVKKYPEYIDKKSVGETVVEPHKPQLLNEAPIGEASPEKVEVEVDVDKIKAFKDKQELDKYAKEELGVELNGRRSLKNMMKDLFNALSIDPRGEA